jgi:DNA-binding IscR family transcriptional regulator
MESRTERLLRAAGNREAFAVLRVLLRSEMTTAALANATKISPSTIERTLETLSQANLVSRRPGTQGAWFITHWHETLALLDAARLLGVAIQGSEDHLDEQERTLFRSLEEAGAAAPAAKRGRRPSGAEDGGGS